MLNIDPYDSKYLETLKISKNMYKMLNNKNEFLKFFKELKNYSAVKKSVKKTINLKKYLFEKVSEDNSFSMRRSNGAFRSSRDSRSHEFGEVGRWRLRGRPCADWSSEA